MLFDALQAGEGAQSRLRHRRHRRPPAHQKEPDGRAREDASARRKRVIPGAPHEVLLVIDATTGPERPGTGAQVHRDQRRHRHRAHQARRHREGRRGGRDRARAEPAHPLRRRRREGGRPAAVRSREVHSNRCSSNDAGGPATSTQTAVSGEAWLARKGRGQTSPNPAVGAVLVRDGEVVGRGFHTWAGREACRDRRAGRSRRTRARRDALRHARTCSTPGRTGPCAERWSHGRSGQGRRRHGGSESAGARATGSSGCATPASRWRLPPDYTAEAEKLNEAFVHFMRTGRPLVTLKAARHARRQNRRARKIISGWITSETARAHVQQLRHDCRRHSDGHRHGAGRRLPADGSHGAAAQPSAVCASCSIRSCGCRSTRKMVQSARGRPAGGHDIGGARRTAARRSRATG